MGMASQKVLKKNQSGAAPADMEYLKPGSQKNCRIPGFILSERRYAPRLESPPHSHRHAIFCLAVEGAYTAKYGPKTYTCEPSSLIFHAPNELHSEHFSNSTGHFLIIEIEPWWLEHVRKQSAIIESSVDFSGSPLNLFAPTLYREFREMDEASPLVVEGLMMAMVGMASRRSGLSGSGGAPRWLEKSKELLHDRFMESLTLDEIAENVGVNSSYLAQMFQKYYRDTVGGYLRRLRIDFARQALINSDTPLCHIALTAGFSDQSHLSRMFKRYMGVTPAQYRKALGKTRTGFTS